MVWYEEGERKVRARGQLRERGEGRFGGGRAREWKKDSHQTGAEPSTLQNVDLTLKSKLSLLLRQTPPPTYPPPPKSPGTTQVGWWALATCGLVGRLGRYAADKRASGLSQLGTKPAKSGVHTRYESRAQVRSPDLICWASQASLTGLRSSEPWKAT